MIFPSSNDAVSNFKGAFKLGERYSLCFASCSYVIDRKWHKNFLKIAV